MLAVSQSPDFFIRCGGNSGFTEEVSGGAFEFFIWFELLWS